jgi:hypothetical protein
VVVAEREVRVAGILAVWNDIDAAAFGNFERWYNHEHLHERVAVPGFRFGRRYELVSGGDRRFFAFYEVERPEVLTSPAYVRVLDNPTPWTREIMPSFRRMVRSVCELAKSEGRLIGAYATVLRADEAFRPAPEGLAFVSELAQRDGVARVQLWVAAEQQTRPDTAEMKMRGKDQAIAGALVVETVRRSDADAIEDLLSAGTADRLGISGPSALGTYQLLCVAQPA